jgi:uncharacterized repeat protein (TIGR03803 family)
VRDLFAIAVVAMVGWAGASAAKTPTESGIYSFLGKFQGDSPYSGLIADSTGTLYGTTTGLPKEEGTVFKLTPPAAGQTTWTMSRLYAFQGGSDGATPEGRLIMDKAGALYGTTTAAKGSATVFKLIPPGAGQTTWTKQILVSFGGTLIDAGVVMDAAGALFGTVWGGGSTAPAVFKLSPPASGQTAWTLTTLYAFQYSNGANGRLSGLLLRGGVLYGVTATGGAANAGTVFQLSPPPKGETAWTETELYAFQGGPDGAAPLAPLIANGQGALFGSTSQQGTTNCSNCGTIFELLPPAAGQTGWTETVLHTFAGPDGSNPQAALTYGPGQTLFGTTFSGGAGGEGTVFKLAPDSGGQNGWTYTQLSSFNGGSGGAFPLGNLLREKNGILYGTTDWGGVSSDVCHVGCGTVFQVTP